MSGATTITRRLVLPSREEGTAEPEREPCRRPARVAQLLALAHRWQRQIDAGEVDSQKAIAKREGVTPARVSQVMRLLCLAPELQERVHMMEAVDGVEPMAEKELREVALEPDWREQVSLATEVGAPPQVR